MIRASDRGLESANWRRIVLLMVGDARVGCMGLAGLLFERLNMESGGSSREINWKVVLNPSAMCEVVEAVPHR